MTAGDLIVSAYDAAAARLEKLGLQVARHEVTQASDAGRVTDVDRSGLLPTGSTVVLSVTVAPTASTGATTSTRTSSSGSSSRSSSNGSPSGGEAKGTSKGRKKK